jgi:glycosyltransferase involved in cell wall biosynthesis
LSTLGGEFVFVEANVTGDCDLERISMAIIGTFCLNHRYSTTRVVTTEQPKIEDSLLSKVQARLFLPSHPQRQGEGGLRTKGYFKKSFEGKPLISVITVVLNGREHLEQTIQSVLNQTYDNVEYIIIDGGSTDGTLNVIKKYENAIDYWMSEPDDGISDAFNKGIMLSQGDYIGLLNACDWLSEGQLKIAGEKLHQSPYDFIFGDLIYCDLSANPKYRNKGDPTYAKKIRRVMPAINHPTVLARRSIFQKLGGFDIQYRIAMDYEWFLRVHTNGIIGVYEPRLVANMSLSGVSDVNFAEGFLEVRDISIKYGYPAILAWSLYYYRVVKGRMRRCLETMLPVKYMQKLRMMVNPLYRSIS